jgi:gamma-glutamyltranspeptidase/glutathione hydrolase
MPGDVFKNRTAIVTAHSEANAAAEEVFAAGGNAFDAAVAACMTLCVVAPQSVGLAGYGGSCVAFLGDKKNSVAIDFDSRAPLAYRDDIFADPETRRYGYLAVSTPGVIAGLDLILREYGTLSFAAALKHAAAVADKGFVPDPICYKEMQDFAGRADPGSVTAFFGPAGIPAPNQRWSPRDLAKTIHHLMEHGAADFYQGELAERIVNHVRAGGGILAKEDMARYQASIVEPLHIHYRGYDLYTPPPPAAGMTVFQTLKILSHIDPAELKSFSARTLHLIAEALKIGWQDRDLLGDPDFVSVPVAELLDDAKAKRGAAQILTGQIATTSGRADTGIHTVNICSADAKNNAVSLTVTTGFLFGSQRCVPGTGMILGHGMSRFDYIPGHANFPAPLKRMQHNMSACIALQNGKPKFIFGLPGGTRIVSVTAQMAVELIDLKMSPERVTAAPRIHTEGAEPLTVTESLPEPLCAELIKIGHKLSKETTVGGPSNAIAIDDDGKLQASSSPRGEAWVPTERSNQ